MFLLPIIGMGTFLTVGLTILAVAAVLGVIFYFMYHTFHGDLPGIMKMVIGVFLIIAIILIIANFI